MAIKQFSTFKEYQEIIEKLKKKPIVVGFSRDGCQPCVEIAPVFEEISNEFDFEFYKLHVTKDMPEEDIVSFEKANLQAFPTFILLYFGCEIHKTVQGDAAPLRQWFDYVKKSTENGI